MNSEQLSAEYTKVNIQTAGKLKSQQLLLEKALLLFQELIDGDLSSQVPLQNIFSQLQSSLNLKRRQTHEVHKMYSVLWDAAESLHIDSMKSAKAVLKHWHETVLKIQGL